LRKQLGGIHPQTPAIQTLTKFRVKQTNLSQTCHELCRGRLKMRDWKIEHKQHDGLKIRN